MRTTMILLIAIACWCGSNCDAAATLDGVNLGTYVTGPKVSASDLKGRVVLFEYWGVHCPPCVGSIPHLSDMQKKYGRDNFIVVANHCQGEPVDVVRATWTDKATNDMVSVVADGELEGSNVSGIPHCFLFNHEGKLIYDGSPYDVEDKLDAAMKLAPGQLVAGRQFKHLSREAAALGAQKSNLAGPLRSVRKAVAGSDAAAKEEADFLVQRLDTWTGDQLSAAQHDRSDDPAACQQIVNRMTALLSGDDYAKPFSELADELKKDKAFQGELKAATALAAINDAADRCRLSANPSEAKAEAGNRQAIIAIAGNLKQLQSRFPDTVAARTAATLAKRWGL